MCVKVILQFVTNETCYPTQLDMVLISKNNSPSELGHVELSMGTFDLMKKGASFEAR